jgi:hypothetical protein
MKFAEKMEFYIRVSSETSFVSYGISRNTKRNKFRVSRNKRVVGPIISSKVAINFNRNSDRNSEEINFAGPPTYDLFNIVDLIKYSCDFLEMFCDGSLFVWTFCME